MAFETAAIYGGIGTAGLIVGWLVRGATQWARARLELDGVKDGHGRLKAEFISHKDDRDIHIDPRRDTASMTGLKHMIAGSFETVNTRLDKIDSRCEKRGETCLEHFSRVEQRIAAATGKTNGGKE